MSFDIKTWDGQPISEPGIYADIPMEAYHGQLTVGPSISGSGAKTVFYESPAHYFVRSYLNPDREEEEPSKPLLFGRGAHHLLLGERAFEDHFLIRPTEYPDTKTGDPKAWNGNATWCKEWLATAKASGKDVLTAEDLKHIRGMAKSLSGHPLVGAGILDGLIEHSFVWRHETGVWLKWRPDAIPNASLDISDLKTIADITDDGIQRAVALGYHMQGALGAMACRAVLGREMETFSLVFVEKTPPYAVRVKTLKPADIELGVKQVEAALRLFAKALETDVWHPPGGEQSDAEYVDLPVWAVNAAERRLDLINAELES